MKTSAKIHQFGSNPPEVTIINSGETEPAVKAAGVVVLPAALITGIVSLVFPGWIHSDAGQIVLGVILLLLPYVSALITRGRVWSPAGVKKLLHDVDVNLRSHYESQLKKNNPYERPDKI